jgi:hypothetical protein|nr:MAG TPA: hypothetical protein [Caudoviricetes sp.]
MNVKEEIFLDELKAFDIEIEEIKPEKDLFNGIQKAICELKNEYLTKRLEVVLNENLIEVKDKITNFRTILGCRVSYDDLPKDLSFIVRQTAEPTYEYLQQENAELKSQLKGTTHCYDEEEHRKLENNWNELKRWLYEDHYLYAPEIARNSIYQKVLEKVYEIEKESNSNEI